MSSAAAGGGDLFAIDFSGEICRRAAAAHVRNPKRSGRLRAVVPFNTLLGSFSRRTRRCSRTRALQASLRGSEATRKLFFCMLLAAALQLVLPGPEGD